MKKRSKFYSNRSGATTEFKLKCRRAGLRVTPQRCMIYAELVKSDNHPSAEMLYSKVKKVLPNISLDTVNRTLLTLADIGAARLVEGSGDVRRFDGCVKNHQHFKCLRCRKIIDFHYEPFDSIETPDEIEEKFTVIRKTVYIEGICDICKKTDRR